MIKMCSTENGKILELQLSCPKFEIRIMESQGFKSFLQIIPLNSNLQRYMYVCVCNLFIYVFIYLMEQIA